MIYIFIFTLPAYASQESQSLDDVMTEARMENKEQEDKNQSFINGITEASNIAAADIEGAEKVTEQIRLVAAWIVQVLAYFITAFLAVRVVLDLVYIGIPFTRSILSNGFAGNTQAGGQGTMGAGMGAPGMGMGMGQGMGMGMGNGMMGGMGGRYGSMGGRYGGMGGGMMGGGMNPSGVNQQGSLMGRVQWVSNAALTAVASENNIGVDGKVQSPFKIYAKDMIVTLIIVPVLLVLAATGALTNLGFLIGNLLCDAIAGIGEMF